MKPLWSTAPGTELKARKSELDPVCLYCPRNKRFPAPSTSTRASEGVQSSIWAPHPVGEPIADPTGGEGTNPSLEMGCGEGPTGCRTGQGLNSHWGSGSRCKKQNFNRGGKWRLLEYSVHLHRDERERKGNKKPQNLL